MQIILDSFSQFWILNKTAVIKESIKKIIIESKHIDANSTSAKYFLRFKVMSHNVS